MKEKHQVTIRIILVFLLIIGSLVFKVIPEYKETQGSSDKYIDTEKYTDIVEITINNKPNFALVIEDKIISNILFFDQESICLYNKNIEGSTIKEGTKKIIELLIENDYLKQNYFLIIKNYKNISYTQVKNNLLKALSELDVNVILQEETTTIKDKAKKLDIESDDDESNLKEIELISKNIIRRYKNHVSTTPGIITENITEDNSRNYTDTVYKKIEKYVRENNITNQTVNDQRLEITKIPANSSGTIFPDETSWYYVENKKVYAYISIKVKNKNYNYCYQSSIDEYKKGQC